MKTMKFDFKGTFFTGWRLFFTLTFSLVMSFAVLLGVLWLFFRPAETTATVSLTEQVSVRLELRAVSALNPDLVLRITNASTGKLVDSHNFSDITRYYETDYLKSKDASWKTLTCTTHDNGVYIFSAIWGELYLDEVSGDMTVEWFYDSTNDTYKRAVNTAGC